MVGSGKEAFAMAQRAPITKNNLTKTSLRFKINALVIYLSFTSSLEAKTTCSEAWDMQYVKHVVHHAVIHT
jgi:hypothetical protein